MGLISFELVHNNDDSLLKRADTLKDIWNYIRLYVNVAQDWSICQINNGDIEDTCNACYLVETFKTEESLPQLISDIQH